MFSLPVEFLRFNRLALRVSRYSQVHNSAAWKNDDQKLRVRPEGRPVRAGPLLLDRDPVR